MSDFWWQVIDSVQSVLDGVMFGSIYALIGIGFTLIFGVMHKINLAYAAASIGGAYASLAAFQLLSAPALVVFLCAAVASGFIGYAVYICCFRFIPTEMPLATLMASVGMLILIDEVVVHATAGMPEPYPAMFDDVMIDLEPFWVRGDLLMIFVLSVIAMLLLLYILYRTRLGIATRAVAGRVGIVERREIGFDEALVVAVDRAHLAGPAVGDDQVPRHGAFELVAIVVDDSRLHAEERPCCGPGLEVCCARQRRYQDAPGLGLPPGIDDRAAPFTDDIVVPGPGLGVDRLSHGAEQPQ